MRFMSESNLNHEFELPVYFQECVVSHEFCGMEGYLKIMNMDSVQFNSVAQSCLTLCDSMNHSTPGLPVHHQHPESTQSHVHCVGDAIQVSHPLLSRSPPALNISQHQGLFH